MVYNSQWEKILYIGYVAANAHTISSINSSIDKIHGG